MFDDENPFISISGEADSSILKFRRRVNTKAVKVMKNEKSPVLDSFTIEFYNFLWKNFNLFLFVRLIKGMKMVICLFLNDMRL